MKIFCIRKNIFSHRKKNLLFLPCNMAAMQNLYCCLHINWNGSFSTYCFLCYDQCLSASSRQIIKLKDPCTCLVLIECDCSKTTRPNTSFFHPPLPWFFPFSSIFHHLVKKKLHQLFAYFNAINSFNPFTPKSDLIDFTLSNARRFYSWKGDPLGVKGLQNYLP